MSAARTEAEWIDDSDPQKALAEVMGAYDTAPPAAPAPAEVKPVDLERLLLTCCIEAGAFEDPVNAVIKVRDALTPRGRAELVADVLAGLPGIEWAHTVVAAKSREDFEALVEALGAEREDQLMTTYSPPRVRMSATKGRISVQFDRPAGDEDVLKLLDDRRATVQPIPRERRHGSGPHGLPAMPMRGAQRGVIISELAAGIGCFAIAVIVVSAALSACVSTARPAPRRAVTTIAGEPCGTCRDGRACIAGRCLPERSGCPTGSCDGRAVPAPGGPL